METYTITQKQLDECDERERRVHYPGVAGPGKYTFNESENTYVPVFVLTGEYEFSSGYIGAIGVSYDTAAGETLANVIENAAAFNHETVDAIQKRLDAGESVPWRKSPNYEYDHSTGMIRRKRTTKPVQLVKCDCGHRVPAGQRMNASLGTSCPDCYDRMSD